jgi:hypothetical protein
LDVLLDKLLIPATATILLVSFWLFDLWRAYRDVPPHPWLTGGMALLAWAYAAWSWKKAWPMIRRIKLARDGERSVGQGLEELRDAGYSVYHDILGDSFNVDHLLVGPAGVFTIETKTWKKPHGMRAEILVDGDSLTFNGKAPIRDPVSQARAQASWIADVLRRSTGTEYPVISVVVFPGWWVEIASPPRRLWVLNDKMLRASLAKAPVRLSPERISMAKFHIEAFTRSQAGV